MTTEREQNIRLLGGLISEGRVRGQVPQWFIDPTISPEEAQALYDSHEVSIGRLIDAGVLAWKVGNTQPGRPKVLYTTEPKNPLTNRLVSAYLWMTPLAVIQYGQELHDLYVQAITDKKAQYPVMDPPLPFEEFKAKLLLDTVPASPTFASQVPTDILAATTPKKKVKPKAGGMTSSGDIAILGPRNSELIIFNDYKSQDILTKLDQWKVGPSTRLTERSGETKPGGDGYIERVAILSCGLMGVDWLVNKGFAPDHNWYFYAMSLPDPDSIGVFNKIKALGVDPQSTSNDGFSNTLWHLLSRHQQQWSSEKIQWLRQEKVDWSIPDSSGTLPLTGLLRSIQSNLHSSSLFNLNIGGMNIGSMFSQFMPGMASEMAQENKQRDDEIKLLSALAEDMLKSGVDPFQKALDGSYPWQTICPEQFRTQQLLASRLPAGTPDPEGEVMRQMFFGDRKAIHNDREAYGPEMLAFIDQMEQAYGGPLLDPPSAAPKAKRAHP